MLNETLGIRHAEFVSGYKEGRLECDISSYEVNKIALAGMLSPGYRAATNFFAVIWILSWIAFIPAGYFLGWGWGLAIFLVGLVLPKGIRATNAQGVLEKALEDEQFYEAMTVNGILRVHVK